jgi:anti-sigma-K factor RskA
VNTRDDGDRETEHEEFDVLAAGWALHALEPDDEQRFAAHLPTCASCRLTVSELEATLGELAVEVPESDPPADLLGRIHRAMAEEPVPNASVPDHASREKAEEYQSRASIRPSSGPSPTIPAVLRPTRHAARWLVAAAAVVLVALAGWNVVLQQQLSRQQARETSAVKALTQVAVSDTLARLTDPKGAPVGLVLRRGAELDVLSTGMPINASGTSYWLWALPASGAPPLAMGRFHVGGTSASVHAAGEFPTGLRVPAGFAVSVENGTARPSTPSKVIATGNVTP